MFAVCERGRLESTWKLSGRQPEKVFEPQLWMLVSTNSVCLLRYHDIGKETWSSVYFGKCSLSSHASCLLEEECVSVSSQVLSPPPSISLIHIPFFVFYLSRFHPLSLSLSLSFSHSLSFTLFLIPTLCLTLTFTLSLHHSLSFHHCLFLSLMVCLFT